MKPNVPELLVDCACQVGENPLWHPLEQRLYWIDILSGSLWRCAADGSDAQRFEVGVVTGGFTFQRDGGLLLFMARCAIASWRDGVLTPLVEEIPEEVEGRFNDVIADPHGRVFCGAMPVGERPGRLYRLDPDGDLRVVLTDIGLPNGLAFSTDLKRMFLADSYRRVVLVFDYDATSGELSKPHKWLEFAESHDLPDGLTVDVQNNLWLAFWGNGLLVCYNPNGLELRRLMLPAHVTSLTFGGEDLRDVYVTSTSVLKPNGPGAGGLFHLNLGVRGRVEFESDIRFGAIEGGQT